METSESTIHTSGGAGPHDNRNPLTQRAKQVRMQAPLDAAHCICLDPWPCGCTIAERHDSLLAATLAAQARRLRRPV